MDDERAPAPALMAGLIAFLCLIWGSTWLVIRGGLEDLPPFTSAGARFVVAALVMTVVAWRLRRREGGAPPPAWLWLSMGLLNFAASYGVVYWCETILPSGIVAVLWAVYPLITAGAGHLLLPGERLHGRQWAGFVFGFLGVGLLFLTDLQRFGASAIPAASILFISPLVSAAGTVLVKRYGGASSSVLLNRNAMFVGAGVLLALAWTFEADAPIAWSAAAIASILYLAIVGTVVTFGLFFWLIRHAPAYRMSLIAYITPVIALSLGWGVGAEPVTSATLAGAGLILAGVALAVRVSDRDSGRGGDRT
ncbi:MAG: EamA family transporter [Myxococcales bacterium]|nr:EamA family transporter [Myxococcales bacterium]